jgi:hypothetical protein
MVPLVEKLDIDGKDCINYLIEYEMFGVLESRIMNLYITQKWECHVVINCDIMDHSTSYCLVQYSNVKCTRNLLSNDRFYTNVRKKIFKVDRSNETHILKFEYWRHSMYLRYQMELIFTFGIVCCLTWYVGKINKDLHKSLN